MQLIQSGLEQVFGNPLQDPKKNPLISNLRAHLSENSALIDKVLVHFVFRGDPLKAGESAVLESYVEDLQSKKFILDKYLV